jgi:hypothetical protein
VGEVAEERNGVVAKGLGAGWPIERQRRLGVSIAKTGGEDPPDLLRPPEIRAELASEQDLIRHLAVAGPHSAGPEQTSRCRLVEERIDPPLIDRISLMGQRIEVGAVEDGVVPAVRA